MAVLEGLAAIAQGFINQGIAANYWYREPKLWLLSHLGGEMSKGQQNLDIGRPSAANVFQGTKISQAQKMSLQGVSCFKPRFAIANPTNVTVLGSKSNSAALSSPGSVGGTQGDMFGTAQVNWTGLFEEEILIPEEHLNRAARDAGADLKGRALARSRIIEDAVNMAKQNMLTTLASQLQHGNPTDQDADPMDQLIGFDVWFSKTNYCAGVDRSAAKNAQFRAIVDSTAYPVLATALIDAANITNELQNLTEDGTVALLVNGKCFMKMKAELLGLGYTQIAHSIPDMAQYGAKNIHVLQKDNVFVVYDRSVPANTAYAICPSTWAFITHPEYTFKVTEFIELWKYARSGPHYLRALCQLRAALVCWNPALNVKFDGITDPS